MNLTAVELPAPVARFPSDECEECGGSGHIDAGYPWEQKCGCTYVDCYWCGMACPEDELDDNLACHWCAAVKSYPQQGGDN